MKIKLLIGLLVALIATPCVANETATSMGDRSWQFGTPFENQVRLNMANSVEQQKQLRNLGAGGRRGLGVGGNGVYIANIESANFSVVENNINSKNQNVADDGSTITTAQTANQNGQTGTATNAGNTSGENSPITNN